MPVTENDAVNCCPDAVAIPTAAGLNARYGWEGLAVSGMAATPSRAAIVRLSATLRHIPSALGIPVRKGGGIGNLTLNRFLIATLYAGSAGQRELKGERHALTIMPRESGEADGDRDLDDLAGADGKRRRNVSPGSRKGSPGKGSQAVVIGSIDEGYTVCDTGGRIVD